MGHQFSRLWRLTALLENACFSFCHKSSTLIAKLLLNEDFLCSWCLAWTWNYMRKLKLFQVIWSEENVEGNNLKLTLCMIWYILEFGGHRTSVLEKAMAPHSSTPVWKIPWMEEPGRLQSMGSWRVGQDWATSLSLSLFTFMHWKRKWQPTPVFLPGEFQGQGSLMGCRLWGHTESDTTEVT